MVSELTLPHNLNLEWLQNTLQISGDTLDTLMQDLRDALRHSGISESSRLNTKDVKARLEREVLTKIRESYASTFEPFSNDSVTKCLWRLILKVQTAARRPTTHRSQSVAPSLSTHMSCTTLTIKSTGPEIPLQDMLIRLLCTKTEVATIISPRDLVPDGDPTIDNVMFERLEDIAITDLAYDKAEHSIVFSDSDGIDYILRNDRNLRTALLSISQSNRNSSGQKGVFKIQRRHGK